MITHMYIARDVPEDNPDYFRNPETQTQTTATPILGSTQPSPAPIVPIQTSVVQPIPPTPTHYTSTLWVGIGLGILLGILIIRLLLKLKIWETQK